MYEEVRARYLILLHRDFKFLFLFVKNEVCFIHVIDCVVCGVGRQNVR